MKVILLEDIKGKGKKDQVINTADGYGAFLIRQKKALVANADNLKILDKKLEVEKAQHKKNIEEALELKKYLENIVVEFFAKLTPRGTIDKKVTSRNIADKLNEMLNSNIDKHKIELTADIDTIGKYIVKIKLYNNILASVEINVHEI